jgi:hypothetical protein
MEVVSRGFATYLSSNWKNSNLHYRGRIDQAPNLAERNIPEEQNLKLLFDPQFTANFCLH